MQLLLIVISSSDSPITQILLAPFLFNVIGCYHGFRTLIFNTKCVGIVKEEESFSTAKCYSFFTSTCPFVSICCHVRLLRRESGLCSLPFSQMCLSIPKVMPKVVVVKSRHTSRWSRNRYPVLLVSWIFTHIRLGNQLINFTDDNTLLAPLNEHCSTSPAGVIPHSSLGTLPSAYQSTFKFRNNPLFRPMQMH